MFVIASQSEYLLNTFVNLSPSISYWYPVPRNSNSAYIFYRFQGTFPHGIDILTLADYYAVGNRVNTYLSVR